MLIPGAAAPKLVSREMVRAMKPGAVVVDVAIDQGGCFETSRPTTHAEPTGDIPDRIDEALPGVGGNTRGTHRWAGVLGSTGAGPAPAPAPSFPSAGHAPGEAVAGLDAVPPPPLGGRHGAQAAPTPGAAGVAAGAKTKAAGH